MNFITCATMAAVLLFFMVFSLSAADRMRVLPEFKPQLSSLTAITYLGGYTNLTCTANFTLRSTHSTAALIELGWELPDLSVVLINESSITLNIPINDVSRNNTNVRCIGKYEQDPPSRLVYSDVAKIVIQGPLSEIDVEATKLNQCTIQVSWNPPFTQPGIPILGYNVTIINKDTNKTENNFTIDTSYKIPSGYDYEMEISGFNNAGDGNESYTVIDSGVFENETIVIHDIDVLRTNNTWTIDTKVEETSICNDKHANVLYDICDKNNGTNCVKVNVSQTGQQKNKIMLSSTLPLDENKRYNVFVVNKIGKEVLISSKREISTYDIQDATILKKKEFLCLQVIFIKGRIATGSFIQLNCPNERQINFATLCSPKFPFDGTKNCSITIYDAVNNDVQYEAGPAIKFNVTVTGTTAYIPSTSKLISIILYCIIAILVLALIVILIGVIINCVCRGRCSNVDIRQGEDAI